MNLRQIVSSKLKFKKAFCLARIPGSNVELFTEVATEPQTKTRQVICKSWRKDSKPIYFFNGVGEKTTSIKNNTSIAETSFEDYSVAFENCMKELRTERLKKVVLSRVKRVESTKTIRLFELFNTACSKYADAFVYLVNHPHEGLWLGASPEILLKKRGEQIESISLAGTQPLSNGEYEWGEKEKVEQALVSDLIREVLTDNKCEIRSENGPVTVEAGAVAHLKTRFLFASTEKIQTLVDKLHPTPAVAGLPRKESIELIGKTELHHRGLYTGYLGVYDIEKADIYVNLRCMQIVSNAFYLYLGGGITKDSVLKKEWQETEYKAQTLLKLLDE